MAARPHLAYLVPLHRWLTFGLVLAILCPYLLAQDPGAVSEQASSNDQTTYHLRTSSRIVLTDVTVTDKNGNRVSGLAASDFLLTDDGHPQKLSSFTEHKPELSAPVSDRAPGNPAAYTNNFALHPPPVLNVLLVDLTNLEIEEQLYLNYQLTKLIKSLPPGEPLALYWCRGPNAVLLQDFTSDRNSLIVALHKALPRFPPTGREYYSSANTLHQLAIRLGQIPGHKNVLWFSGGSVTPLAPYGSFTGISAAEDAALHVVYDELESERISVYPFDARGLVTRTDEGIIAQQGLMREIADNTGGRAFVNTNGLQHEASRLIDSDGAFYTLTYSPESFKADGKWHKVKVRLAQDNTSLQLSYRQGYFADSTTTPAAHTAQFAPHKTASGAPINTLPSRQDEPILFQIEPIASTPAGAHLTPASVTVPLSAQQQHKHGTELYTLRYTLPLDAVTLQTAGGQTTASIGVAVLAFNGYGSLATRRAETLALTLTRGALPVRPKEVLVIDQQVLLPRGDTTLFCAVWDVATKRLGTMQIPLVIKR